MPITLTFVAENAAHAKEIVDRVHNEIHVNDDMIRDYLVRKGWWKPGVEHGPTSNKPPISAEVLEEALDKIRDNRSPGPSAISKIGGSTKEELLKTLRSGAQPDKKFEQHLRLLWSRGEVKFDGEYYV